MKPAKLALALLALVALAIPAWGACTRVAPVLWPPVPPGWGLTFNQGDGT